MTYKSILVHVDQQAGLEHRVALAAALAQADGGQLTGLALTGAARFLRDIVADDADDPAVSPYLRMLRERAGQALQLFTESARRAGMPAVTSRSDDDDAVSGLARQARCSDLCVMACETERDGGGAASANLCADVAMASGCPVLAVPSGAAMATPGRRILIGWNDSREAARAVRLGMPLLRRAGQVEVALFDQEGGADTLLGFLAQHGVAARLRQEDSHGAAGDALLALAGQLNADLLVMGCYGHPRLRELLLGGATRSVLRGMRLPVLLAN